MVSTQGPAVRIGWAMLAREDTRCRKKRLGSKTRCRSCSTPRSTRRSPATAASSSQGCGAADVTLKAGIERMIFEELPEVTEVLDTTDHGSGTNPYNAPSKA